VADAAVGAADVAYIATRIEGFRCADLKFGTSAAKTIAIQFGVKAPAGTYCVTVLNANYNRSYVAEYVIAAGEANTDVVKSVTIPGDTTGVWDKINGVGIEVRWALMVGGAPNVQPAGSWGTVAAVGSASQFNFMSIMGNVFHLYDVSLTEGSVAPPFVVPDYISELAACQRYYRQTRTGTGIAYSIYAVRLFIPHHGMRSAPTISLAGALQITDIFSGSPSQISPSALNASPLPDSTVIDFDNYSALTSGRFYSVHQSSPVIRLIARL
jgi:hypothetical protein